VASVTQNGFKRLARKDESKLVYIKGGSLRTQVLKGDVATVLGWFVREFNATVEKIDLTLFGWRSIETNLTVGGSSDSNHVSGTALDINGARHPWEQRVGKTLASGFSATQVARIRLLQHACSGVVHWGGDYNPRFRDWMHFDVRASSSQLKAAAKKLRGGTVRTTAAVNVRMGASTTSKVDRVIPKGFRFNYNDVVCRGGRLWLHTTAGHYVAAEFTTF